MPELLLEFFSEEIPARMQAQAGRDLARMAEERLKLAGLPYASLKTYVGPRRLTLAVEGLPAAQADREEELKGPRANAPDQALDGFLRKTGLARADLVEREGVLFAVISQKGRPTPQIVAEMAEAILRGFPWPKSMRWGSGTFRWVRPLKRILCLFDGQVVPFEIEGIRSGDLTEGHRFMGLQHRPIKITHFEQYKSALLDHFVVLDQIDRKRLILDGARAVCVAKGVELVEDEGLLEEVSGLAEWPAPVLGDMDPDFLDLPSEVIRTSMRTHQKYFAVRRPGEGTTLAPHFVVVANIQAQDGGAVIAAGNAKVLSARLSDARFFWTEDRKTPLEDRLEKLKGVTFHAKLGTMDERVERIEALARQIAPFVGCTPAQVELAAKAARLAKADLGTGMVGEFPELQGIMGGYYTRAEGLEPEVADAVRDHYKPIGPADTAPTAPVTMAVALADKLDTLVGFFAIDEKPTGSRDPYALRRAALGVIRLLLISGARASLRDVIYRAWDGLISSGAATQTWTMTPNRAVEAHVSVGDWEEMDSRKIDYAVLIKVDPLALFGPPSDPIRPGIRVIGPRWRIIDDLLVFFADRLKVLLRDDGRRHDLVDAVFALGDDDLVRIVARVEALSTFLATEDGRTLLGGYKRAVNILKAEGKKTPLSLEGREVGGKGAARDGAGKGGGGGASGPQFSNLTASTPTALPSPSLGEGRAVEETALAAALATVQGEVDAALAAEDFTSAMRYLAHLRQPVDDFFDKVLVNDPDPAMRMARLKLLTQVRDTANRVADFSLIWG